MLHLATGSERSMSTWNCTSLITRTKSRRSSTYITLRSMSIDLDAFLSATAQAFWSKVYTEVTDLATFRKFSSTKEELKCSNCKNSLEAGWLGKSSKKTWEICSSLQVMKTCSNLKKNSNVKPHSRKYSNYSKKMWLKREKNADVWQHALKFNPIIGCTLSKTRVSSMLSS
jgi:hypothetical protein